VGVAINRRTAARHDGTGRVSGVRRASVVRKILIVDDNEDGAEILAEILGSEGHLTRVAFDGPSALAAAQELEPDLALLDLGLPMMDGYELARRMAELPLAVRPKLVAVTGHGLDTDRARSRSAGFSAHLVKPLELPQLKRVMEELFPSDAARSDLGG
jgi:CheY-like chemotaxis protein